MRLVRSRVVRVASPCLLEPPCDARGWRDAMISAMTPSGAAPGGPESAAGPPPHYPPPPTGYEYYPDYRYMEYAAICEMYTAAAEYGEWGTRLPPSPAAPVSPHDPPPPQTIQPSPPPPRTTHPAAVTQTMPQGERSGTGRAGARDNGTDRRAPPVECTCQGRQYRRRHSAGRTDRSVGTDRQADTDGRTDRRTRDWTWADGG